MISSHQSRRSLVDRTGFLKQIAPKAKISNLSAMTLHSRDGVTSRSSMPAPATTLPDGARAVAAIGFLGQTRRQWLLWRPRCAQLTLVSRPAIIVMIAGHADPFHDRSPTSATVEARARGRDGLADVENFLDAVVLQCALPYRKLFDGRLAIAKYNDHDRHDAGRAHERLCQPSSRAAPPPSSCPTRRSSDLARGSSTFAKVKHPVKIFLSEDEAPQVARGPAEV